MIYRLIIGTFPFIPNPPPSYLSATMGGGAAPTEDTKTVIVLGAAYGGELHSHCLLIAS